MLILFTFLISAKYINDCQYKSNKVYIIYQTSFNVIYDAFGHFLFFFLWSKGRWDDLSKSFTQINFYTINCICVKYGKKLLLMAFNLKKTQLN